MFTGIIGAVGRIEEATPSNAQTTLTIETPYLDLELGESVAVNGVCLTVTERGVDGKATFFASVETCSKTNIGALSAGSKVNLERALRMGDRLSGHLVQGHVDGKAKLKSVRQVGDSRELLIELESWALPYVIPKGSITLDGISLTVNSIEKSSISLMIIPHTWANTTLSRLETGASGPDLQDFNVELDMVAKYLKRFSDIHEQNQ